jgi:outer membrane immunogenic protein
MNKHLWLATVASLAIGLATVAKAADLPVSYKAPVPIVAPVYNWTGIYLGVNGGGAWGSQDPFSVITNRFDNFDINFSGGMFGGTAGAQIQMAHVLLGFEADIDWANITGSSTINPTILGMPLGSFNASTSITSVSTARARVGYAADNWLFYATGGAAILGAKTNLTPAAGAPLCGSFAPPPFTGILNCSGTNLRLGGAVGAGVEYGFAPSWSLKAEYLYIAAASLELSHVNEVRAGLNYRFGGN